MTGKLFVVVALNSMGPCIDARHHDLLNDWTSVNNAFSKTFSEDYRLRYPDDEGNGLIFSLFCISWSGFTSNPVKRDFGWHSIFDNYRNNFKKDIEKWGDDFYWMYNHPPESGIGNEWGLDWYHNSHYLNILNHFIIDREYFPCAVQIPTERNDCSHFLEQWIPFDFGNRNSINNNLQSINADGKTTGHVIDWRIAPHDWSHYHPAEENYQLHGDMKRTIFRIVDIKSIIHVLTQEEIERAFQRCLEGHDTVICAYEHDFRDRYETIIDLMIRPLHQLKAHYPEVSVYYKTAQEAAQCILGLPNSSPIDIKVERSHDGLRIYSSSPLFGRSPYACLYDVEMKTYNHIGLIQIGRCGWTMPSPELSKNFILGLGANDLNGNSFVKRYLIQSNKESIILFNEGDLGITFKNIK